MESRNIARRSPFRDKTQGLVVRDNPVTGSQVRGRKEESPLPRAAENDRLSAPRLGQEPLFNFISQTNNNNDLVSSRRPRIRN